MPMRIKEKLTRFYKPRRLLIEILVSYILTGSLLLTAFSFTLTKLFFNSSLQREKMTSQDIVAQSYSTADSLLTSLYNYFYTMFSQNNVLNAGMSADSIGPLDDIDICNVLAQSEQSSFAIQSVYLYNRKADKILSSRTSSSDTAHFYDTGIMDIIHNYPQYRYTTFLPRQANDTIENSDTRNVITIFFSNTDTDGNLLSALIVNIDQKTLQDMVARGNGSRNSTQILIFDRNGTVISDSDTRMINRNIGGAAYVKHILNASAGAGNFTYSTDRTQYLVTYTKSENLNWYFVRLTDYRTLQSSFRSISLFIGIDTFLFVLIGLLIAVLFTRNIYHPVHRLVSEIRKTDREETPEMGEFEYLQNAFQLMNSRLKQMRSSLGKYSLAKRSALLEEILHGSLPVSQDLDPLIADTGLSLKGHSFLSVVLRIDNYSAVVQKYSAEDLDIFKYGIGNIADEVLGRQFHSESLDAGLDYVALIVSFDRPPTDSGLTPLLEEIQADVSQYFGFTITAGIGTPAEDIAEVHDSFENALETTGYRMIYGHQAVIFHTHLPAEPENFRYPSEEEKALLNALKSRNEEKALHCLEDFLHTLRAARPEEVGMSVIQLVLQIYTKVRVICADFSSGDEMNFTDIFRRLNQMETLDDIQTYLTSFLRLVLKLLVNNVQEKKKETVQSIIAYISEKYSDPNLTINDIANFAGLSTNYTRLIFKDVMSVSVTEFLTEFRVRKLEEMMQKTDDSAKDLSQMVGFSDGRYFYTVFKKVTGMTVTEYSAAHGLPKKE